MYYLDGSVHVENDDQCMTCKNFTNGVACPLLQALGMGLVTLEDEMTVINCEFYKAQTRHLKLVDNTKSHK